MNNSHRSLIYFIIFFYNDECNSAPMIIYCAVGEKSKFKMLLSNNSLHGKF